MMTKRRHTISWPIWLARSSACRLRVATALSATVERRGKAVCGTYPRAVAEVLLQTARQRVKAAGHSMVITTEAGEDIGLHDCKLCGDPVGENQIDLARQNGICLRRLHACRRQQCGRPLPTKSNSPMPAKPWSGILPALRDDQLVATSRQFPGTYARRRSSRRSTGCSRRRRSGSSASTKHTATRR